MSKHEPSRYLDEVEKRAEAATEGPWLMDGDLDFGYWVTDGEAARDLFEWDGSDLGGIVASKPDAKFIAASRTDVPKMAKALRAVLEVTNMHQARMTMGEIDPGNTSFSDGHQIGWLKGEANMSEKVRRAITEALEGEE